MLDRVTRFHLSFTAAFVVAVLVNQRWLYVVLAPAAVLALYLLADRYAPALYRSARGRRIR